MQTIGKVSGGLGLLLLLTSPITYMVTSGSPALAAAKAVAGVVLLGLFVATNYSRLMNADAKPVSKDGGPRPMGQRSRASLYYLSTLLIGAFSLAAVAAVNVIAAKRNKTWDLTQKKIHSLAPQTVSTLKELKEPVTAIGFVAAADPEYWGFEQLLQRYQAETEKFSFEFKDPNKHPALVAKYQLRAGAAPLVLVKGQGDQATHLTLRAPVSEQDLTNAILKLSKVGEQKVYFITGHGEWPLEPKGSEAPGAMQDSITAFKGDLTDEGYAPESLNLVEKQYQIPRDASALVIAGARTPFTEPEQQALRKYLEEGGRVLYFAEATAEPGLDKLLAEYGVQVDPGLTADDQINPANPYVIISAFFADHDITRPLRENAVLPTTRALTVLREGLVEGVRASPVVLSSPVAWVETNLAAEPELTSGEKSGQLPLIVASTRNTASADNKRFDEARLVVFGDSELLTNPIYAFDRDLVLNAVAWASNQVSQITIRPPDRDISTIDIDGPRLGQIRFLAMDLLPLSLIGVGLAIWVTRRSK